jgi:hypothetical protein
MYHTRWLNSYARCPIFLASFARKRFSCSLGEMVGRSPAIAHPSLAYMHTLGLQVKDNDVKRIWVCLRLSLLSNRL